MGPGLKTLFIQARLCQEFPGYTLETVRRANAPRLLKAMSLLHLWRQVTAPPRY